ncbi:MAG: group III truncated hemoglobin [Caulobacteraceae bacterium]
MSEPLSSGAAKIAEAKPFSPGAAAGVDEAMIHEVVHGFYGKVRRDPALGPIFNRVIVDEWDAHLAKMCDFWSSVLLMTGRFSGSPMTKHARIPEIRPTHFARWLHLFRQTVESLCPPEAAALFVARSEMIAQSLQLGIAASRGDLPPQGEARAR